MTFNSAYKQIFLATTNAGSLYLQTSGTTDVLTAGEIGICTAPNNIESTFISSGTATDCKICCGSWHTVDSIAQFWGGLKTSLKSLLIQWGQVERFFKATAATAQQEIDSWGWSQTSTSTTGPVFYCGTPYSLRLDILGAPALRLLNHQAYVNLPAYAGCCTTDCTSGCTSTVVDAATIMLQWKDFITGTQMPYLSSLVTPNVYIRANDGTRTEVFSAQDTAAGRGNGTYSPNTSDPGSVVASFQLTGAYTDTTFGNCTWTPTDYFTIQPVQMLASLYTQDFTPCAVNTTINTSVPNLYTQLQAGRQPRGLGYQLRNDYALSQSYRQESLPDSMVNTNVMRMRVSEDEVITANITPTAYYDQVGLLYNFTAGRRGNPSSTYDHESVLLMVAVPTGTTTTAYTNLIADCLTAVNSNVTLESI